MGATRHLLGSTRRSEGCHSSFGGFNPSFGGVQPVIRWVQRVNWMGATRHLAGATGHLDGCNGSFPGSQLVVCRAYPLLWKRVTLEVAQTPGAFLTFTSNFHWCLAYQNDTFEWNGVF